MPGGLQVKDTTGKIITIEPNMKFKKYGVIFNNLMIQKCINMAYPIVSMTLSYDNSRIIAVIKKSEFVSYVNGYCLHDFDQEFEE